MKNNFDISRRQFLKNIGIITSVCLVPNDLFAKEQQGYRGQNYYLDQFLSGVRSSNDITDALARAFRQLEQTGGELHLPSGIFTVNEGLILTVAKDIKIIGNNTRLIFNNVADPCLLFRGFNLVNYFWRDYSLRENTLILPVKLRQQATNIIIKENNHDFQKINLTYKRIDKFTFEISSGKPFFNPAMVGKNLVTSQNSGITFYIVKFVDVYKVLVIPGNNQNNDPDLAFDQWAIADLWCKSRGYYIKGEILKIHDKTSYRLQENYIWSNTGCNVFYSACLTLNNLDIAGSGNTCKYGVKLLHLDSAILNNLKISQFANNGVCISESANITIRSCKIGAAISGKASNYACLVESSQKITIEGSIITGGYHGVSHGGTFPCRDLTVSNTQILHTANWGLDFHGNCDNIKLDRVYCDNGAYIGGTNCQITKSTFYTDDDRRAALVIGPEKDSSFYRISSSIIRNPAGNAIAISSQFAIKQIKSVVINSCQIIAGQNGVILQSYPYGNNPELGTMDIGNNNWKVTGNKLKVVINNTSFEYIHDF